MRRTLTIFFGSLLALVGIGALALVHFFGPSYGIAFRGKPIFLISPSPARYTQTVLDAADVYGLHSDSAEYRTAREDALETAKVRRVV